MLKRFVVLLAMLAGDCALAQYADVGLVNLVSGNVAFSPAIGAPASEVKAFMKVREGDLFTVASGAQVRLVFFEAARQELWRGPANFRATRNGAEPLSGKPAEVAGLPAGVPQRIARVPEMMQIAKLGGIQVRGGVVPPPPRAGIEQQSAIAEANAIYEKMRQESAADDITPELFLLSALHEYLLYDDMKPVAEEMQRRQPESEDARMLADWVRSRAAGRSR